MILRMGQGLGRGLDQKLIEDPQEGGVKRVMVDQYGRRGQLDGQKGKTT